MKNLKVVLATAVLFASQVSLAVDYNDINLSGASNLPCNHRNPSSRTEVSVEKKQEFKATAAKKAPAAPASSTKGVK